MIAAGISGRNYQRWLIHSLIASFNLFTFGAEQCQPAAVESDLLPAHVTYTSRTTELLCSCIVCVCVHMWICMAVNMNVSLCYVLLKLSVI